MVSIAQRLQAAVKAFATPRPTARKMWGGGWNDLPTNPGLLSDSPALAWSKWGAATAALVNHAAYACISTRAEVVAATPWRITSPDGEMTIASSDDPDATEPMAAALQRFYRREQGLSLFYMWEMHRCITGEMYVELCRNSRGGFDVDMLNSLYVGLNISKNEIVSYSYSGIDRSAVAIPADRIVYDRLRNNLMTEFYGYSPLMAAIGTNAVPLMNAAGRAALSYFNNDGLTAKIIRPDGVVKQSYNDDDMAYISRTLRGGKGAGNKHKTIVFPYPFEAETFDAPELQKWAELLNRIEPQIYTSFRVPRSIAGDSDSQRYQASPEDAKTFDRMMLAELNNIAAVVNACLMPAAYGYRPPVRFEFETARYEHVDQQEREAAEAAFDRGVITVNEYRAVLGYPELTPELQAELTPPAPPAPVVEAPAAPALPADVPAPTAPALNVERDALAKALDELGAWQRFSASGKSRPFETSYIDDNTADLIRADLENAPNRPAVFKSWRAVLQAEAGLTDWDTLKADQWPEALTAYKAMLGEANVTDDAAAEALKAHYAAIIASKRTTATTQLRFTREFDDLIRRAVDTNMRRSVFVRNMIVTLDRYSRSAYIDGFADAGIYAYEPTDDDLNWILRYVDTQAGYVEDFAARVYADDEATLSDFQERAETWFRKSILPAYNEGFIRASKDGAFRWRRGPTSDSCSDCRRLDGKVYRLSTWKMLLGGTLPPCDATECGGYQCLCEVNPTRDRLTRGRPIRPTGAKLHDHTAHQHETERGV